MARYFTAPPGIALSESEYEERERSAEPEEEGQSIDEMIAELRDLEHEEA